MNIFRFLILIFPTLAMAQTLGLQGSEFAAFKAANSLLPHSFPTNKLEKSKTDIKIVPAYMKFEHQEGSGSTEQFQEMDGQGLALGATHGLRDQIGIGILAIGFSMDGKGTTRNSSANQWGENKASGYYVATNFIWDPFKGGADAFHMPLMAGIGYAALEETSSLTADSSSINSKRELSGLALSLGAMAHINLGSVFKISPFVYMAEPLNDTSDTCTSTGSNASCPTSLKNVTKNAGGIGTEITLKPYNFSTQFIFPVDGMTCLTLKWEFSI